MDKEDVADVYNGISLHHKKNNEIMPFAGTWMHPEIITLSKSEKANICGI